MSSFLLAIIVATLFNNIHLITCKVIQCNNTDTGCNYECPQDDACHIICTVEKSCNQLFINGSTAKSINITCGDDNSCSETYIGDIWCSEEAEENEEQNGLCKLMVSNSTDDCLHGCCWNADPVCNDLDSWWYTKVRDWYLSYTPWSIVAVIAIGIFCCCFCCATCCCAACCCRDDEKSKRKRKKAKKKHKSKHKHKRKKKKKKRNNNNNNEEHGYRGDVRNVYQDPNNENNDGFNLLMSGASLVSSSLKSSGNNIEIKIEMVPITPPPINSYAAINNQCVANDISTCNIIDRLLKLMVSYETWNELSDTEIKWNAITQIFDSENGSYDLIQLIDDYNHYLSHHDNTENLMFISNLLSNHQCKKDHINDDIGNGRIHLMNNDKLQVTIQDIFRIEIIDKMHIYFMHTHHEHVELEDDMKEPQQEQYDVAVVDSDTNDNYPHTLTSAYDYIDSIQNTKSIYSQYQPKSPKYKNNNNNNTNHNVDDGEDDGDDDDDDDGVPLQISRQSTLCDVKKQILAQLHCRKSSRNINKYVTKVTAGQESQYKINYDTKEIETQRTTLRQTESIDMVRKTVTIDSMLSMDEGFDDSEDDELMNKEQEEEQQELGLYCFGRRWYYWTKYKQQNHKDYINAKYANLKEELLHNSQYTISEKFDWDTTYLKAQSYEQCARAKCLFANGILVRKYYGKSDKQESIPIHTEHIAALLFYTNYDELQATFSESFRILDGEEDWNNAKIRNAEFANWSRLLRESVELYGLKFRDYPHILLYHGINCELMFESVVCQFCAPTSMTTSMGVAESFSDGFGLILEVKLYDLDVAFFDCSWLSNYPTEDEKLLMGGGDNNCVLLNSIILSRLGHNYGFYIQSVGIIQNMFDGRRNPQKKLNKKTIVAVKKLIQSIDDSEDENNDIPYYVQQLFYRFCNNWTKPVIIDIHKLNKKTEYGYFKDLIVNAQDEWIQIDKICKMFKNTKCIKIINGFNLTEKTLNKLYDIFNNNDNKENIFSNLNQIEFQDINEMNCNIEENTEEFERINWNLGDFRNNNHGNTILLIRSSSVEIANNDNVPTPI